MRIFALEKQNPEAWAFMPYTLERVGKFCFNHATDIPATTVANALMSNFVSDKPITKVWIAQNDTLELIGHCLALIEEAHGIRRLTILQWEMDESVDRNALQQAFDEITAWGIECGTTEMQLLTINEKLQKVFERYWGFRTARIVMRRPLRKE
jgi:hypothetical protein